MIVRYIKAKIILQNATRVLMFTKKTSFLCNLHVVTNKVKLTFIINHQQNMFNHILPEIDLVITSKNDNVI